MTSKIIVKKYIRKDAEFTSTALAGTTALKLLEENKGQDMLGLGFALRQLAQPVSQDELRSRPDDFLQVWGFVPPDRSASRTRQRLINRYSVLTELTGGEIDQGQGDIDFEDRRPIGDRPLFQQSRLGEGEKEAVGVDVPLELASKYTPSRQHYTSRSHRAPTFGTARDAMRLIGAGWAKNSDFVPHDLYNGSNVNVVIVDEGLSFDYLRSIHPDVRIGGGFTPKDEGYPEPGQFKDPHRGVAAGHGNMIARNILRIAPNARIFDAPLLPPRISNIETFTADAQLLLDGIEHDRANDLKPLDDAPWIIVNAWAAASTLSELTAPLGAAGVDPDKLYSTGDAHPLHVKIDALSDRYDFIFASGNCGEFEPVPRSGLYDRGAGRSITGANARKSVLTVSACDVTGRWVGMSSQGPGAFDAPGDHDTKPNIMMPSWFCENSDRAQRNTGTSASCGVAAGLAAAMRTPAVFNAAAGTLFEQILGQSNLVTAANSATEPARGRAGNGLFTAPSP